MIYHIPHKSFVFLFLTLFLTSFGNEGRGQTTLPASWDFKGAPPNGWTISGTDVYTSSSYCIVLPACKLDNTGDYAGIFFSDVPGVLTYYLRGSSFSGGKFSVQESSDGANWADLRVFTSAPASMTQYTDNPAPSSQYIRFYYTQKSSGNISLDDVNIAAASPVNTPRIKIQQSGNTLANGATFLLNSPVGVLSQFTFSVQNLGLQDTLFLNAPAVSGTNASEFNLSSFSASVPPSSSASLVLDFTPQQAGTRTATLSIGSNDPDRNPFIINLYGAGGSFATTPQAQPANLVFTNKKSFRFRLQYSAATPAPEGYIVLRKKGSPVTEVPADGKIYLQGDSVGTAQVAYTGSGTNFYLNNIVASTAYYFAVFSYNGPGKLRNYLEANPLTGSNLSSANMMGGYYTGIDILNPSFVTDLHNKIYPHYQVFYSEYADTYINKFACRDTAGGFKALTCVYSGENLVYYPPFYFDTYSREHTFCHSWMPTYPADNPEQKEYDDYHNLFPANFPNANQKRLNYPLDIVVTPTFTFLEGTLGKDANNNTVYEPRDAHKGDAARAMFYMCTAYHTVNGKNWFLPSYQSQDILKQWHLQDPVDNWEVARNDFLDSLQGNRNPFVDHPEYACYIDFYTMTKIANPPPPCYPLGADINDNLMPATVSVFPNPNNGKFTVSEGQYAVITDLLGNILFQSENKIIPFHIDASFLSRGIYFLKVKNEEKFFIEKLVIN